MACFDDLSFITQVSTRIITSNEIKLKLIKHDRKYKIKFQETIFRCKRHLFLVLGEKVPFAPKYCLLKFYFVFSIMFYQF